MHTYFTFTKFVLLAVIVLFFSGINAQDTTWVQGFQFDSRTRDSVIHFPSGNHNQYEKILMYYTMRCKDGLVSTGSDRNKGCGEWDYSCNTNIIDSSGVDSLKVLHPNYIISGVSENYFYYTTRPTYTYYDFVQKNITVNSQSAVNYFAAGPFNSNTSISLHDSKTKKSYFMYNASETGSLFTNGKVYGIQLNPEGTGKIAFAKIKIATTKTDEISADLVRQLDFKEVYNRQIIVASGGKKDLIFHSPYQIQSNGDDNIIVEISYTGDIAEAGSLSLVASGSDLPNSLVIPVSDRYIEFNGIEPVKLPVSGMKQIDKQITVSFWSKGNETALPKNTSVFTAEDQSKNRQLNVHLPWSNSRIYWDCGNDGTGYDRIDKATVPAEFEGVWNHWAFTKNSTTGSMKIYLNGVLWHSGTGKTRPIDIDVFALGADISSANPWAGSLDDFAVWDKELTAEEITAILFNAPAAVPALAANLVAYYDMNEADGFVINDKSQNHFTATFIETPYRSLFRGADTFKSFYPGTARPDISFITGNFNLSVTEATVRDSVMNAPTKITPYSVSGGKLIKGNALYYWASGFFPVYDENGDVVDEVEFPEEDIISVEDLVYYDKFPSKYELLSFVTPYGIGLDFGLKGKTWIFDVTDYGPVLKQSKRLTMDKGGEWQEDIDIKFAFIKGTPARNILSIQPVWPATVYGYTSILNNNHLEERDLFCEPEVRSMKVRTVATGHGQEGEFIPRNHSLNVNGGNTEFIWQLWKECADNPVYPQGGTWVYDRAGWCPGAPSDLREFEIMPYVSSGQPFSLDYGLNTATGDSRYIVNTQLVKYGPPNFQLDAALEEIITPSKKDVYSRINPICSNPVIVLKNNGKTRLTSATIKYGVEGYPLSSFSWTGNLDFLQTQKITLPNPGSEALLSGNTFTAFVEKTNNAADEYSPNDRLYSTYTPTANLEGGIIVVMKTNGMPNETKWTLRDDAGNIIKTSKNNLTGFTLYQDTIQGLSGCYQLQFTDSDDDGISWWANGDGDGFIRAKGLTGAWHFFQPDFGKELTFNFTTGLSISTQEEELTAPQVKVRPNPTHGEVIVELEGYSGQTDIEVFDGRGKSVKKQTVANTQATFDNAVVDLENQPSGMYFIQVRNGLKSKTVKVTKW